MITEDTLCSDPELVILLTGLPAERFWHLVGEVEKHYPEYNRQRLEQEQPDRKRAVGGGRKCDTPLVTRTAALLTYLRLHIIQTLVAKLFSMTQSDISRDLRRLLPLLKRVPPVPDVWEVIETRQELAEEDRLALSDLADGQALVDATEQQVYRSQDSLERRAHYSGKKKMFTLKTQFVTDGDHHIEAISESAPGAKNDKKLCDGTRTIDRLPDGCCAKADKGYQGIDKQVSLVTVVNVETGEMKQVPRLTVETPFKKPKGGGLTEEQIAFNRELGSIRVRVEHCIGWVKNWHITSTRFRCDHRIYSPVMQVVCGLANWQTQCWQTAKALARAEPCSSYCA